MKRIVAAAWLLALVCGPGVCWGSSVVARGDGIEVTRAEVNALRRLSRGTFKPSGKMLVQGAVRNVVFAHEAASSGLACPGSEEVKGFARTRRLARCFIEARLRELKLREDAVESFYRANWSEFFDRQAGKMLPLDEQLREKISQHILAAKRKIFVQQEYRRLCRKYHVVIIDSGSRLR